MSAKLSETAAELQSAAESRKKRETFLGHSTNKQNFSKDHFIEKKSDDDLIQESRAEEKTTPSNAENNAFLIKLAKGASLQTITLLLKNQFGAHYCQARMAWSIPLSAQKCVEDKLTSLQIAYSLLPISDEYFRKTKTGKEAANKWIRIDILEKQHHDEGIKMLVDGDLLEKEIIDRKLNENDKDVIGKRSVIENRKEAQKILQDEIDQLRNSVGLLEKYDEENPLNAFLIEPGKTHLAANKAKELLSNPEFGVYQRMGQTVRIVKYKTKPKPKKTTVDRPDGAFFIAEADDIFLVKLLSEIASWERYDKRTKNKESIDFSKKAAQFILSDRGEGLSVLTGLVCSPTLREDGSILHVPGYDPQSGLVFDPCGTTFPSVPDNPSKEDAERSLALLKDLLKDFKFDGEVSHSVAIAEIMTGVVRRSLSYSPAFGNNAPEAGSGKSLLGDVTAIIATGNRCTCVSPSNNEEENRKRLASALLGGDLVVCIDNVQDPFESDSMCTILTSQHWQERLLGTNTNAQIPTNSIFVFTGNNLTFRGDMCSRVVMCHIDPQTERPGERIFDRELREYTAKHRGELVTAVLTIIRAYIVAGCPDQNISPFRLFSDWTKWIRSPLVWLGMKDPYESTRDVTDNDPVREELSALFSAWYKIPTESSSIKQLLEVVNSKEKRDQNEDIQALYDTLIEFTPDGKGGISSERLGKRLRQCKGRIVKGFRLDVAGKDGRGAAMWRISKLQHTA